MRAIREHQRKAKRWVVDLRLANFFDKVKHDLLIAKVRHRVKDVRMIKLICAYLSAGVMSGGLAQPTVKGTHSTRNRKAEVTHSVATPTTATSTWAVAVAANE